MVELKNDTLAEVLTQHQIDLSPLQVEQLDHYRERLWDWNQRLNLTRHTDYEKFVGRDVVDAMVIEAFLPSGARILDVGSGGGVPGVILAIVRPDLEVHLCESVGKRAKALESIVEEAGLSISVHHARAEVLLETEEFDELVARAVASVSKMLTWFAPHWNSFGRLLTLKGPAWVDERLAAREAGLMRGLRLRKLRTYPMPGSDSESVLLEIRPQD